MTSVRNGRESLPGFACSATTNSPIMMSSMAGWKRMVNVKSAMRIRAKYANATRKSDGTMKPMSHGGESDMFAFVLPHKPR